LAKFNEANKLMLHSIKKDESFIQRFTDAAMADVDGETTMLVLDADHMTIEECC
jgi:hypothetical protein